MPRIADYPPVKAALDAADAVCDAEGSMPWELTEKIATLRSALEGLTVARRDNGSAYQSPLDEGEGWE